MKTLGSKQVILIYAALGFFAYQLHKQLEKKYFPVDSDSVLQKVLFPLLVFVVVFGAGAFIQRRFFPEKPQDKS